MAKADGHALWRYFEEIRATVDAANRGDTSQPYIHGSFMVSALAQDVELTISDISEEDAVLITAELLEMGVKAVMRDSLVCPHCNERVPLQTRCIKCRARLPGRQRSHPSDER